MRRECVTIARKTISYLVVEPSAPAVRQHPVRNVVFLHAFPLQAAMWEPNLGAIPVGWRAIAPDLRGFGDSPLPDADRHRMTEFAGDVIDLLDRLEISETVVIGCSMGGYVLFEMLKSAPRYVSAVGLVSTRAGADSEEGRKSRAKTIEQVDREGVEAIAAQMVPKLLGPTSQRERPDLMKRVRNLIVANSRDGIKASLGAMMERGDSTPLLDRIKIPALIVSGTEDTLIPPTEAGAMHRAIPNSEYEAMPFAGHLPNMEQSAPFDARLWQFLQKL
jgi:pimeloyl-ACP methyl ester carboxylesterase